MPLFHRTYRFVSLLAVLALLIRFAPAAPIQPVRAAESKTASQAAGQPAGHFSLLKDIITTNMPSLPKDFFNMGSHFVFTAWSGSSVDTWASDGTPAGTAMANELGGPMYVSYNGQAYFAGGGSTKGNYGLWATDGTSQGTHLVFDSGPNMVLMWGAVVFDNWLFFLVEEMGGYTLWRTDGTAQHTALAVAGYTDIGYWGRSDWGPVVYHNAMYYRGRSAQTGDELWRLPSATEQPELVKDICPNDCRPSSVLNSPGSWPRFFKVAGDRLFFVANDEQYGAELWVSDGTPQGTQPLTNFSTVDPFGADERYSLVPVGNLLYFTVDDGPHGGEIWRSDGTQTGTTRVTDFTPSNSYFRPNNLVVMNGALFFAADDGAHGDELWKIASPQSAPELIDIFPGFMGSNPDYLTTVGQGASAVLYFAAQNVPGNLELWRSGGTLATTQMVKNINPGPAGSSPEDLFAWNNKVVFCAYDAMHGDEPWVSDGTPEGTLLLKDINTDTETAGSRPFLFNSIGGSTYFTTHGANDGYELWRTDGTPRGTIRFQDPNANVNDFSTSFYIAEMNGITYFSALDPGYDWDGFGPRDGDGNGSELWRSDGTPQGTWRVKDINPGWKSSYPTDFVHTGNLVFFEANDGIHGKSLWKTDGTANGTTLVRSAMLMRKDQSAALGSTLIFGTSKLWRSDGTVDGTVPFSDITGNFLNNGEAFGGALYLNAGGKLYATDGTTQGTREITLPGAPDGYSLCDLTPFLGSLYFTTGSSLWKLLPGAGEAERIRDFTEGSAGAPSQLTETLMIFSFVTPAGITWWASDGTANGTRAACPECVFTSLGYSGVYQGKLFFYGDTGDGNGMQIWVTDGSASGTHVLSPSAQGLTLTNFGELTATSHGIVFSADDGEHGQELWVYTDEQRIYLPMVRR